MKTLKDLTPEIIEKIPSYKEKCLEGISSGQRFRNFNLEDAEEAIYWNYEKCGYKKPVVIVAENPLEMQLLFNYIKYSKRFNTISYYLYCLKNNIKFQGSKFDSKLRSQLNRQLESQLSSQLDSQLCNQLRNQLDDQLNYQLGSQLRNQLWNQLGSQLWNQLLSQLDNKLDIKPHDQLENQLGSQLNSQLSNQLFSQLDNKLDGQLHGQPWYQLRSQLDYQLDIKLCDQLESQLLNQLDSQLHGQLWYQLRSQLLNQLDSQLHGQLWNQLRSQLDSQIDGHLCGQLWNQLNSQLLSQLWNQLNSQLHDQLDSQLDSQLYEQLSTNYYNYSYSYLFTLNVYSNCYYTWYKFIKEEFNLPLTIEKDFEKCFYLQRKSRIYSAIFSELVCVVSKYPKKIYWNNNFQLHNIKESAIEWNSFSELTKLNCYRINGRIIPNYLFEKEFTKEDFYKETNEEIRAAMYEIKADKILEFLDCKLIDSQIILHRNGDKERLELYQTKERFKEVSNLNNEANQPLCWLKLVCPSTGTSFLIPTDSTFNNALDAAKYHRPLSVPLNLNYSWNSRS